MHAIRRDPALTATAVATGLRLLCAFAFDFSDGQQAALNAVVAAAGALWVAVTVRREGQVPAILGLVQAVIALGIGFGLDLNAETQAVIMSFAGTVVAMFVRTQVEAPTHARA